MRNGKRYLVCGGFVISKNDGQRHYVDARRVARLYHVDPVECHFVGSLGLHELSLPDVVLLMPDSTGQYKLTQSRGVFERDTTTDAR